MERQVQSQCRQRLLAKPSHGIAIRLENKCAKVKLIANLNCDKVTVFHCTRHVKDVRVIPSLGKHIWK